MKEPGCVGGQCGGAGGSISVTFRALLGDEIVNDEFFEVASGLIVSVTVDLEGR